MPTSENTTHIISIIQVPEFETIDLKNETEDFDMKEQEPPQYPLHFDNIIETKDIHEVPNSFFCTLLGQYLIPNT